MSSVICYFVYLFLQFGQASCSYGQVSSTQCGSVQLDKKINAIKYNLFIVI